jgi:hypothetical protein
VDEGWIASDHARTLSSRRQLVAFERC